MDFESTSKESAVIVLHDQESDTLILTQRTIHLREHPGEICFPGGRWEEGDPDFWSTALRELNEELGIASPRVNLKKALTPERTLHGSIIHPWLATVSSLSPYQINPNEVDSIVKVPIHEVYKFENYKNITIERYGLKVITCQFTASSDFIWGATARIMKQLCTTSP